MSTYKISTKDLQGPIADKLESINISTFNDLSQIGLEVGSETIDGIMQALPEYSILQLAITSENNSSIYPNTTGTLIIEDIYSTGATFRFYAKVGEVVKVWKGLYVGNSFSGWNRVYSEQDPPKASDISGVATTDYVDTQITKITETGIPKLQVYPLDLIVGEEDQTEFAIDLSTFDANTDTVLVQKGMLWLNPNGDYTVEDGKVVLSEGTSAGQTIGIWVWKNVPLGEDGSVSGTVIAPGTLPLNALPSTVVDAINGIEDLKKSVSDGKELVANAITAKGVNTATDAEFAAMAANISSIVTLDSVPSLEAKTWTPGVSAQTIAAGNYLKGAQTIKGDANLVASNIAKGKSIFGVSGTYDPLTSASIKYKNQITSAKNLRSSRIQITDKTTYTGTYSFPTNLGKIVAVYVVVSAPLYSATSGGSTYNQLHSNTGYLVSFSDQIAPFEQTFGGYTFDTSYNTSDSTKNTFSGGYLSSAGDSTFNGTFTVTETGITATGAVKSYSGSISSNTSLYFQMSIMYLRIVYIA